MKSRVSLVLEGILPHAWDISVVEDLLGKSCAVEEVAPETRARSDLALFKLSAWTSQVEAIPVARMLAVPKPVTGEEMSAHSAAAVVREGAQRASTARTAQPIQALQYRVLVHVVRVEEEGRLDLLRGPRQSEHGPRGFHGNGPSGGSGGEGGPAHRTIRDLAWRRGVPDQ
jgi:hypothetical protein